MWLKIYKFLTLFIILQYTKAHYDKASYLNHHLSRFKQNSSRYVTTTPVSKISEHHKLRHTKNLRSDVWGRALKVDGDRKVSNRWVTTERPYYRSFSTTTEASDFEDENFYDYVDKDNDDVDMDEEEEEDDEDLEDEDNDDSASDDSADDHSNWQAEQATTRPSESLTEMKWRLYGSRSRVEESRRNHHQVNLESSRLLSIEAQKHKKRIDIEAGCLVPRPRVVSVQSVHSDSAKAYIPHCTVLHQCGEDSGCCGSEALVCAVKHLTRVELYFYVKTVGRGDWPVEKLTFENHTECECRQRSAIMSGDRPHSSTGVSSAQHVRSHSTELRPRSWDGHHSIAPIRRCQCPELYTPRYTYSQCRCDCNDGNRDCMRRKRGKEHFSLKDRVCILNGQCGYPACEFGTFIRHMGRCPKKLEGLQRP